jgi:aerobic-type carbon monoxide dehydrogenase small subunit (CoxS/CutS family)
LKSELKELKFTLNGKPVEVMVKPKTLLVELIRKDLHLTGTKQGCLEQTCGACTVNIDGKAVRSCSVLAMQANGHEVVTIEGVADGEKLHPIQQAMINHGAIECGFCTSGMVMSSRALLLENPDPSREEVRDAIQGNICADEGYIKYIEAIEIAAKQTREGK